VSHQELAGPPTSPAAHEALRHSEQLFRQLVENVAAVFWISDVDTGRPLYVSPAYEVVWGRTCASLYEDPLTWLEAIHPQDRPAAEAGVQRLLREGAGTQEYRVVRPDGSVRWVRDRGFAVRDETGRVYRIAGMAEDVTDRRRAEELLRDSEQRNRLIAELTTDYAYTCRAEPGGRYVLDSVSDGFTRLTGYTLDELNERGGWEALIDARDLPSTQRDAAQFEPGRTGVAEVRIRTKAGETRFIRYSFWPVADPTGGRIVRLLGAVQDVTDRRRAEDGLREYARRHQALSRRLLEVQEQERRSLARELHDEVGQLLTGLRLTLEAAGRGGPESGTLQGEADALVRELSARVRDLSLQLRPTMLDDLGLLPALLWLFDRYTARTRVRVAFEHRGLQGRLGQAVETAAYRIVQEALTNVARHAGVDAATVRVWLAASELNLQVEDRGHGFDAEAQAGGVSAGISGMQERAELLGGRLSLESRAGWGTRVSAVLPVAAGTGGP
jgi:PAS domain S-box-containing protein